MNIKAIGFAAARLVVAYIALLIFSAFLYKAFRPSLSAWAIGNEIRLSHLRELLLVAAAVLAIVPRRLLRPTSSESTDERGLGIAYSMRYNWKIALLIGAVVAAIILATDHNSPQDVDRLTHITDVWMPHPITGQRFPYYDVEILDKGPDYIRFRTTDDQTVEQHGAFSLETRDR